MTDRVQDIDAIDAARDRLMALADDAEKLQEAAAEANPAAGTWGVILGAIIGIAYTSTVGGHVKETMEDVPLALRGYGIRMDMVARNYEGTEDDIAKSLIAVTGDLNIDIRTNRP